MLHVNPCNLALPIFAEVPANNQGCARDRQAKASGRNSGGHHAAWCVRKLLHLSIVTKDVLGCGDYFSLFDLDVDLAPLYVHIASELGWTVDQTKLASMKEKNAAKLAELDAKIKDAQENLGETEVRDALRAKADYLAFIGDKEAAVAAYKETESKSAGSGNKMDLVFSQIRCEAMHMHGCAWTSTPLHQAGHIVCTYLACIVLSCNERASDSGTSTLWAQTCSMMWQFAAARTQMLPLSVCVQAVHGAR